MHANGLPQRTSLDECVGFLPPRSAPTRESCCATAHPNENLLLACSQGCRGVNPDRAASLPPEPALGAEPARAGCLAASLRCVRPPFAPAPVGLSALVCLGRPAQGGCRRPSRHWGFTATGRRTG